MGRDLGVDSVRTNLKDVFPGEAPKHPSKGNIGVCEDERPDVKPLRLCFAVSILYVVDIAGLLEIQESVHATEGLTKERSLIGIADKYSKFVTVACTLSNEAHGQIFVDQKLYAGL